MQAPPLKSASSVVHSPARTKIWTKIVHHFRVDGIKIRMDTRLGVKLPRPQDGIGEHQFEKISQGNWVADCCLGYSLVAT